jgi:hypothetical protein
MDPYTAVPCHQPTILPSGNRDEARQTLIIRALRDASMRFYVMEKVRTGVNLDSKPSAKAAAEYLKYMAKLEKKGKIIGGPCLDILGNGYVLETKTIEEMGEIFFASPANFMLDREVHPLGSFLDSLEGMKELA